MNRTIYLMLVVIFATFTTHLHANEQQQTKKKERVVYLLGKVSDSFTEYDLKAHVTVMKEDSTVIDTITTSGWDGKHLQYAVKIPAQTGKYIIKAECDGYTTGYTTYHVKYIARNTDFNVKPILLKKIVNKEVTLDGVVVTATKVKFTYRGDTIVYDASAFNVPEGSMLDAIVRQLPGAEIKSNGDIYVGGKKIESLLLNGKDFFKGNNKIMLENLPYYTVKELKVYNRSTEMSRLMGNEVEAKEYVMDVGLKREYSRGYMANAEVAGGTKDRYLARLFGLFYTKRTHLAAFGNINNVNENRTPGNQGDWTPSNSPQGQKTTRQAGVNFDTESKGGKVKDRGYASVNWESLNNMTRSAGETFASSGNIFQRSVSDTKTDAFSLDASNDISIEGPVTMYMRTSVGYSDNKSNSRSRSATYSADPSRFGGISETLDSTFAQNAEGTMHDIITNRSLGYAFSKTRKLNIGNDLSVWTLLPWGDRIGIKVSAQYDNTKPSDNYTLNRNEYVKASDRDMRNLYCDSHNNGYSFSSILGYTVRVPNTWWNVTFGPKYEQMFKSNANQSYRLDQLGGEWQERPEEMFTTLPSSAERLANVLDQNNSRHYNTLKRSIGGTLEARYNHNNMFLRFQMDILNESERILYHSTRDTSATRRRLRVIPNIMLQTYSKLMIDFNYRILNDYPEYATLMPYTNDSDPLAIRINNPDLKTPLTHNYRFSIRRSGLKNQQYLSFFMTGDFYHNTIDTRSTFNSRTGGYTYISENVNSDDNWDFWTTLSYGTAIGKKKLFGFDGRLWFNELKRTGFDVAYDDNKAPLCKTLNSELGSSLYLSYQKGKITVRIGGKGEWKHTTSNRVNFTTLDTYDFEYGGNLTCQLPLGITLATDLKEYCRRRYIVKSMNTNDLVWNASLTRSFCKGKFTLKAEAFDLLHQLSSTQYAVNAQARTETWRNTIPSYCMMHVSYKFTKKPKNNK